MTEANDPNAQLEGLIDSIVDSYEAQPSLSHLDATFLPNRAKAISLLEKLRRLLFPGFFDEVRLTTATVREHLRALLPEAQRLMYEEVREALRYDANRRSDDRKGDRCDNLDDAARAVTDQFFARVPELRELLATDVQAAFDGDPAAVSTDETIFCYPGVDAIFIHRMAHELYKLQVPMLPRIMSEYAHNETGIDIHPGAQIGPSFFIDHGTGVVIGETCEIGSNVKVYQGVTLGAISTKGGQEWRGRKRHPTIGADVTIYGGAIILGGETEIGQGSTIGGSVFLMESVPPHHTVAMKHGELDIREKRMSKKKREKLAAEGKL